MRSTVKALLEPLVGETPSVNLLFLLIVFSVKEKVYIFLFIGKTIGREYGSSINNDDRGGWGSR